MKAESAAYYSLQDDLAAQEAYLAQSDLLEFIRDPRYSKSPTTFANAMAALPLLGWRQSSTRSKKDCPPVPHGLTYEMFTIVCNWFAESAGTADVAIERVRAILTDPRQNNSGIKEFRSNWYFLKNAIRTAFEKDCELGAMPYQVFGDYQRSTKSIGPLDLIRTEEDQLRI